LAFFILNGTTGENMEFDYEQMRKSWQSVPQDDPLHIAVYNTIQNNPWLKVNGAGFDDGLYVESDYEFGLIRFDDIQNLAAFFHHGNWGLRTGVTYRDLVFVNQVNGGDEWLTLKILPDGTPMSFESITFLPSIENDTFERLITDLVKATPEQCKKLEYSEI
jgi:hypothetical protein